MLTMRQVRQEPYPDTPELPAGFQLAVKPKKTFQQPEPTPWNLYGKWRTAYHVIFHRLALVHQDPANPGLTVAQLAEGLAEKDLPVIDIVLKAVKAQRKKGWDLIVSEDGLRFALIYRDPRVYFVRESEMAGDYTSIPQAEIPLYVQEVQKICAQEDAKAAAAAARAAKPKAEPKPKAPPKAKAEPAPVAPTESAEQTEETASIPASDIKVGGILFQIRDLLESIDGSLKTLVQAGGQKVAPAKKIEVPIVAAPVQPAAPPVQAVATQQLPVQPPVAAPPMPVAAPAVQLPVQVTQPQPQQFQPPMAPPPAPQPPFVQPPVQPPVPQTAAAPVPPMTTFAGTQLPSLPPPMPMEQYPTQAQAPPAYPPQLATPQPVAPHAMPPPYVPPPAQSFASPVIPPPAQPPQQAAPPVPIQPPLAQPQPVQAAPVQEATQQPATPVQAPPPVAEAAPKTKKTKKTAAAAGPARGFLQQFDDMGLTTQVEGLGQINVAEAVEKFVDPSVTYDDNGTPKNVRTELLSVIDTHGLESHFFVDFVAKRQREQKIRTGLYKVMVDFKNKYVAAAANSNVVTMPSQQTSAAATA